MADQTAAPQQMMENERMKTMGVFLSAALEAEGNFLHLYDAVMKKVDNSEWKDKLKEFKGDHERHVKEINNAAKEIGAECPVKEAKPSALGQAIGKKINGLSDENKIMMEFMVGENFARNFYMMAMEMDAPPQVMEVLRNARDDEERHHKWAMQQMKGGRS